MAAVCAMSHTYEPGLTGDRHDMRFRPRRLAVSKVDRDKALHYLASRQQYRLRMPDLVRAQLTEVVRGYSALCDEDAALRGIDWMRDQEQGGTPTF